MTDKDEAPAPDALMAAIRDYKQADEDGVMVLVSRQACDEAAARIEALTADNKRLREDVAASDAMRELAEAALAAETERCAKVCEDMASDADRRIAAYAADVAKECSAAIRASAKD